MQIRDLPYADPGVPDVRSGFRLLVWLGRSQRGGQFKALAWGVLHLASIACVPVVAGLAVEAAVDRSGEGLAVAGGAMAAVTLAVGLGDTMLHRAAITNWVTAAARVQQLLARRTAELGATLTRRVAAGEVVAVSTGDIERIGWCVEAVSRFSAALLTTLAVCAALVVYEPQLGLLACAGMLALALTVLPLLPRATRRADFQRERAGRATELAADTVSGLRVLRGIGGEELFLSRYREVSQEVRRAAVRTARMWALIEAVQVAVPGLLLVGVVWFGAGMALDGRITAGELVMVYGAMTFLLFPLRLFGEFAMSYSFSRPSAARAARVLSLRRDSRTTDTGAGAGAVVDADADSNPRADSNLGANEGADPGPFALVEGAGHGSSGGPPGLCDQVSGLHATTGQLTAVVCGDPDEAGQLAERLGGHPATDPGETRAVHRSALLDGVALDAMPLERARTEVLVQDKDPVLLSGTLAALLDVPSSGAVSLRQALEAAHCADVLTALVQGSPDAEGDPMRARLTERGRSLSGGQRQRLALARSLVADPGVLVLDEPTSAVDSHTEARIARSLRQLRAQRTTVVLSSSPLLLDSADRVVFVHNGKVAAEGTHRELIRTDAAYRAVVTREPESAGTQGGALTRSAESEGAEFA